MNRDLRGRRGPVGLANPARDIEAIHQHAVALRLRLERDGCLLGQHQERRIVFEADVVLDGFERQRAIHRAGL